MVALMGSLIHELDYGKLTALVPSQLNPRTRKGGLLLKHPSQSYQTLLGTFGAEHWKKLRNLSFNFRAAQMRHGGNDVVREKGSE
jgi:hypothetical protein